jgi:hypothetical protein
VKFPTLPVSFGASLLVFKELLKMTNQDTQIIEDEGAALGGALAPSSRSVARRRVPVIQIRAYRRPIGSEEANSLDDDVPVSIGELAVKLVAEWSLPRMRMLPASREADAGSA